MNRLVGSVVSHQASDTASEVVERTPGHAASEPRLEGKSTHRVVAPQAQSHHPDAITVHVLTLSQPIETSGCRLFGFHNGREPSHSQRFADARVINDEG